MTMTIYLVTSHKLSYIFANKERKNSIQYTGTVVYIYMCVCWIINGFPPCNMTCFSVSPT
jgi:hypothetical protein